MNEANVGKMREERALMVRFIPFSTGQVRGLLSGVGLCPVGRAPEGIAGAFRKRYAVQVKVTPGGYASDAELLIASILKKEGEAAQRLRRI
ncbi:hypothetical protein GCM10011320_38030 [Neoroseomonas lacus]|uniref:Uncharacterized protein n=1 Tax=Neoroseomonas lacus TaxID=287609 RepID=A0A917KRV5_9PROT|nr:hypothetical protein GCM10011320_38030 [Neoroseomonas lacus]